MIGNVFESYCWNWDIGNWFDFLSSKRAFFKRIFFTIIHYFGLFFCSFLSISGEDLVFLIFFVLLLFNFFKCRGKL